MSKILKETIHANGFDIGIYTTDFEKEYISLTDIARHRSIDPRVTIHNWLRSRDVVEFLGLWEILNNPDFKRIDFDTFKQDAGANAFVFSIKKWVADLNAVGLVSKSGRYGGGIYAHVDIAFEFASWISPELTQKQISYTYANEADLLNVVLFGKTAKQWRDENPKLEGNVRDNASLQQLLVLANMESYNAILIQQGTNQEKRMHLLHDLGVQQMKTLCSLDISGLPQIEENKCLEN